MLRSVHIAFLFIFATALAVAQPDLGTGADGALVVSSSTVINAATTLATSTHSAGTTTIDVADTTGFSAGDEILIVTVFDDFGAPPMGTAGVYELNEIQSVGVGTLTLVNPLANGIDGGFVTVDVQVVEVKQYTSVTVTSGGTLRPAAFGGVADPTGGILALRCTGTVDVQSGGAIVADSDGHLGGGTTGTANPGQQGDSFAFPGSLFDTSANDGGGGAGDSGATSGSGGGGGGYGSNGSNGAIAGGATPGTGGASHGSTDLAELYLGSGGGSGGGGLLGAGGFGGDGGGIVFIVAQAITVAGDLGANGELGGFSGFSSLAGGGGGGSGGSVHLTAYDLNVSNSVRAVGGSPGGGDNANGGGGGVGRIRVNHVNPIVGLANINPAPFTEQIAGQPVTAVGGFELYR